MKQIQASMEAEETLRVDFDSQCTQDCETQPLVFNDADLPQVFQGRQDGCSSQAASADASAHSDLAAESTGTDTGASSRQRRKF